MLDDSVNRCAPLHWLCFKVCHKFEGKINKIVFRFFFFISSNFELHPLLKKLKELRKLYLGFTISSSIIL